MGRKGKSLRNLLKFMFLLHIEWQQNILHGCVHLHIFYVFAKWTLCILSYFLHRHLTKTKREQIIMVRFFRLCKRKFQELFYISLYINQWH